LGVIEPSMHLQRFRRLNVIINSQLLFIFIVFAIFPPALDTNYRRLNDR